MKNDTTSTKALILRLLKYSVAERRTLALGLLGLSLGSAINLLFPYLIRKVVNDEAGFHLANDLWWITCGLLLLFLVQAGFFYIRHFCFQVSGYRVAARLRKDLYDALMSQDVEFFDLTRIGDHLTRLTADTQMVQRALTMNVSVAVRYLLQVLGGVFLMFYISTKLALLIVLFVPVMVLGSMRWGKKLRAHSRRMQEALAETTILAEESMTAFRTVQAFAGSQYEQSRFGASNSQVLRAGEERAAVAASFSSVMVFVMNSSLALIVAYGGSLALAQELSVGDLTGFFLYGVLVAVSFGFLVNVWEEFASAAGAAERVFQVLDSKPEVVSPTNAKHFVGTRPFSIEFANLSFSYASRPDRVVLDDVSMEIPAAQTVAVVGPSGAGKSTLAALIPRFYDAKNGAVLVGGRDVREVDLQELRKNVAIVAQNPQVFSASIKDNIRYGRLEATDAEVIRAAEAANLDAFVRTLPSGYDTPVGDKGIQLSGGEKQRLAIARAILKDAGILILDEATSSLDGENEALVQTALERLMKNRTTLIIAHRLSTVQHADKVIVLQDGKVVQEGTHHALYGTPGLYKSLVEYQLLS